MAWFSDLAGKAETLLNNLDEQTGVALRNNVPKRREYPTPPATGNSSPKPRQKFSKLTSPPVNGAKSNYSPKRVLNTRLGERDVKKEPMKRITTPVSPKHHTESVVGDMLHYDYSGLRNRRFSLPTKKELVDKQYVRLVETVECENTMLKNELNALHHEVSQLLERLVMTEDGNDVVVDQELAQATKKLETVGTANHKDELEKLSLSAQFEVLKLKVYELTVIEMGKQKQQSKELELEINLLKNRNKELEELKEREELSEMLVVIRNECRDRNALSEELRARCESSERVVAALRDALKEERSAKTRAEAQVAALNKDLKTMQSEINQTVIPLRSALRDKDNEIARLKEMAIPSTDTSALNVADYDDQVSLDNEKIQHLTQTLVQRQGKIDSLLADNNMLRIQMEKLESKYKSELAALRAQSNHSVVQLQDDGRSRRTRVSESFIHSVSLRLFRYPVFRLFVLFYMLGLHFWVITVLLTSTPDTSKLGRFKGI